VYESIFTWTNESGTKVDLAYEPDGMPIEVPPGKSVRIVCRGDLEGSLEIHHSESGPVVFGWTTSRAEIFVDEALVYASAQPMPPLPPGMSTKQFLGRVFVGTTTTESEEPG
jgi:hypothetical protein